ncbi:MAG TPA: 50S ribosomal protein L4 [Clostridia bacterium]|nr:50S ribosomal protein L4 [Clostridia bacterium]
MEMKVVNATGKKVGTIELNSAVFEQEYNEALIHQVVVAQLANKRQGTKSTLTRAEVRGGGIKPWRQKGTGRARQGSIRAPQWIKGGVVFAPKPRDFSQKINQKMKVAALKSALSAKVRDNEMTIINEVKAENGKTKEIAAILKNLKMDKRVLLVVSEHDELVIRACRNIENVTLINASLINVYDVVSNANCIMTKDAVKKIEEVYA